MPNNRLEALLQGIDDGGQLEQLAGDLLAREGYDVDPTGTRGPDGGRDAFLERGGETGILHCTIQPIDGKIDSDAEKAANRPEDFDQFIFATTDNPSAAKRDRLERELSEEYGWQVKIYDLARLRSKLLGTPDNKDLIREHLHIELDAATENAYEEAEKFYESRLSKLQSREGWIGDISEAETRVALSDTYELDEAPLLAIHIIPAEAFSNPEDRLAADFSDPPFINGRPQTIEKRGDCIAATRFSSSDENDSYDSYTCFHEDGWSEAVTIKITALSETESSILTKIDKVIVGYVEEAIEWYQQENFNPPFYVFTTILFGGDFTLRVPDRVVGPSRTRVLGDDVFTMGDVTISRYDQSIPESLRKPLYRLWTQAGWRHGSMHYSENSDDKEGEAPYEWDPYEP